MRNAVSLVLGLWLVALGTGCSGPGCDLTDTCDGGGLCFGEKYCGTFEGTPACVPRKLLGARCSRNGECVQNVCESGVCVASTAMCSWDAG